MKIRADSNISAQQFERENLLVVPMSAVPAPRAKALPATAGPSFRLPALLQPELRHAEPKPEGQVHGSREGDPTTFGRIRLSARSVPRQAETDVVENISAPSGNDQASLRLITEWLNRGTDKPRIRKRG